MINGRNTAGAQWTNGWGVFKPTWVLHMILPLHDIKHQLNEKFPSALNLSHQLANGSIVLVVSYIWQPVLPHLICLLAASMFNWKHGTMEPSFEDWNQLMGAPENTVNHPWSGGSKNPLSQIFFSIEISSAWGGRYASISSFLFWWWWFSGSGGGFLVVVVVAVVVVVVGCSSKSLLFAFGTFTAMTRHQFALAALPKRRPERNDRASRGGGFWLAFW